MYRYAYIYMCMCMCITLICLAFGRFIVSFIFPSFFSSFLQNHKKAPPIGKHQPAKIGAIQWTRLLSAKLKISVLAFKRVSTLAHHIALLPQHLIVNTAYPELSSGPICRWMISLFGVFSRWHGKFWMAKWQSRQWRTMMVGVFEWLLSMTRPAHHSHSQQWVPVLMPVPNNDNNNIYWAFRGILNFMHLLQFFIFRLFFQ